MEDQYRVNEFENLKGGRSQTQKGQESDAQRRYGDILGHSYPFPLRHARMPVEDRAAQFAPFAALRGLDETIRQQEIIYEPKRDLSEEKKNELDMKLRILAYGMKIQATYFQKSWKNPLIGQYHTLSGTVEFFDPSVHLRIDDTEIQIQDICDLTGDVFETIEISC